mgnify:CR=1 FL=1
MIRLEKRLQPSRTLTAITPIFAVLLTMIVGGAMYGSSVAWFLTDNPDFNGTILVVERDPTYEFTSTSHTNSCMRQQFSAAINIKVSQFAADFVKNFRDYMGGDPRVTERPEQVLPAANVVRAVRAPRSGKLSGYDVRQVGMTVVELGGGRTRPDAPIDPSVGLSELTLAGSSVHAGDSVAVLQAANEGDWNRAEARFLSSLEWDQPGGVIPVIREGVGLPS